VLFGLLIAGLASGPASAEPSLAKARGTHAKAPADDAEAKAREALAVIDGTTHDVGARTPDAGTRTDRARADEDRNDARAIARGLKPWRATLLDRWARHDGDRGAAAGSLDGAERLEPGDGYYIRRPTRAYGAPYVVKYLRGAVAEVRALYPDVPTLAIGDLSAEHGGELAGHVSHRTGRDVDIGFYFHHAARGFEDAGSDLDLEATWALVAAFARTADRDDGVQMIFLDYAVQKRLYDFAKARGTPDDELSFLFQYPAGKDGLTGLVRHWPNHANHLHVRFKAAGSR
jgi:hypothetical protein